MTRIAPPGLKVRPNHSLERFARDNLLSREEWEELDEVAHAAKPKSETILEDGTPRQIWEEPSPAYLRRKELEAALLEQFRVDMASGRWAVTAIPKGGHSRQSIALELIENAKDISFAQSRIRDYFHVEITESSGPDRYLTLKWFIEQVCAVIEPKRGVGKVEIQNLADKLLDFEVRDDIFKSSWTDAKIPDGFRKPGRAI
tara:strand:+ start:4067 stop:4669 length:603 start_codon:yes stop_codon:yes gene_type:complete